MPTISIRDGKPAINVKDSTVWARHRDAGPMIDKLGDEATEAIYHGVGMDFWESYAQSVADSFGYGQIYSTGRSGGWLIADNVPAFNEILEPYEGSSIDYATESSKLDDLRVLGTCGKCLARVYRNEECVCEEGEGEDLPEDIEEKFDEQQELVGALIERDKFHRFAVQIDLAMEDCGRLFVENLRQAIEADEREIVNRTEAAARDIITID